MRRLITGFALAAAAAAVISTASHALATTAAPAAAARTTAAGYVYHIPRWHAYSAALTQKGCWYVWAAAGPCGNGYDCSGLVVWAYARAGIWLPHNTYAMLSSGRLTQIGVSQLKPGDLVFMYGGGHVELYTGWWGWTFGAHTFGTRVGFTRWSDVYGFYHVNGSG